MEGCLRESEAMLNVVISHAYLVYLVVIVGMLHYISKHTIRLLQDPLIGIQHCF